MTKELVELHGGSIEVRSAPGEGSEFTIALPISSGEQLVDDSADAPRSGEPAPSPEERDAALVLVIEDNIDMLDHIRATLGEEVRVIEAIRGDVGLRMCIEQAPDVVVSDVMMPGLDGIEVCRQLKGDQRTSHIPIVLLTARAGDESRIEGLDVGADDYIEKPFRSDELVARVRNLIRSRRELRDRYRSELALMPSDVTITPADAHFVEHLMEVGEGAHRRPGLQCRSVRAGDRHEPHAPASQDPRVDGTNHPLSSFARCACASRPQLLESGEQNVTEVAYTVGFRSPTYFAKRFREAFGETPSEYAAQRRPEGGA